jgi:hypothetical protein
MSLAKLSASHQKMVQRVVHAYTREADKGNADAQFRLG